MRYGGSSNRWSETAADILRTSSESELRQVFKKYGEEELSSEIAAAIVEERMVAPIETTQQLVAIVLQVYRTKLKSTKEIPWIGGLHPATKVFQALRIAVNHELEVVEQALPQALAALSSGGRLAVISFHSLEDRIVKHYFQSLSSKEFKIITKKPVCATELEVQTNPPSRSAKLRVIEKL
jgi:16S rRNA (cytosine1402-N4)-methyltransferase